MARAIAQVTLQRKGGLAEDQVVNTWHFEDDSGFGTSAGFDTNGPGLMDRLETFYKAIAPTWLAVTLSGAAKVTLYDWDEPKPRVPKMSKSFTIVPAATALPGEVALCLSFRAEQVSGQAMNRRRGRVFLGPLQQSIAGFGGGADVRPGTSSLDGLLTAAKTMATGGSGTFRLAVYSPTTTASGGSADDAWNDVVAIWADDAFDTIRKRGASRTLRRTVLIAGSAAPA